MGAQYPSVLQGLKIQCNRKGGKKQKTSANGIFPKFLDMLFPTQWLTIAKYNTDTESTRELSLAVLNEITRHRIKAVHAQLRNRSSKEQKQPSVTQGMMCPLLWKTSADSMRERPRRPGWTWLWTMETCRRLYVSSRSLCRNPQYFCLLTPYSPLVLISKGINKIRLFLKR